MELAWQLIINGLIVGSGLALVAYGFGMMFWITRTFHFAHGAVYAFSGYFAYVTYKLLNFPLPLAILLTIAGSAILGVLIEITFYRPLRRVQAATLTFLITSVGLLIAGENLLSLIFGVEHYNLTTGIVRPGWNFAGAYITPVQAAMVITALALFTLLQAFFHKTGQGRLMRAVADNPDMARIVGINIDRTYVITAAIGSALAAPAGLLISLDRGVTPDMGLPMILLASIAVIVGGVSSMAGSALGAYLIGLAMSLGILRLPSEWQDGIAFGILLIFIIFRPRGFFGQKLTRKEL